MMSQDIQESLKHPGKGGGKLPDGGEPAKHKGIGKTLGEARGSLSAYMTWPIWVCVGLLAESAVVTLIDWRAGGVACAISMVIVVALILLTIYYYRRVSSDLVSYGAGYAQIQRQLLQEMDIPYAVADENGTFIWMNQAFREIASPDGRNIKTLTGLFPDAELKYPKGREESEFHAAFLDKRYRGVLRGVALRDVVDSVIDLNESAAVSPQMYGVYLEDETVLQEYRNQVENERMVAGLIYLDNYDEVMDSTEDVRKSLLVALIDRQINKYISSYAGVIRRLENDKYFAVFTYEHLKEMQENRFSLTEAVKQINIGNTTEVTISMGLGLNGGSYARNYEFARTAIDMALGRGGDQVVLKDGENITYYGGKTQNQGKNTRVRARVKAQTLRELIESMDNVMIMGHHISDADCIGASIGIYRAAVTSGKRAHIVLDTVSTNIRPLLDRFRDNPDYEGDLFINNETALDWIGPRTLLVVVDNNRPSHCECPELLEHASNVVVIDHHRQAKDYIENTVLSYVEPYASSASEMVAEILQYYADNIKIRPADAEAMYSGIVVDTNNFLNKTGVRTFEAAAFLRRCGVDVTTVRKLFRDDMNDYVAKAEIVRSVEIFASCYAIGVCPAGMINSPTVIAAQAANELLGIRNIKASFVLTEYDHLIYISARSIDELNVQVIMEKLGGGGHLSVAGAQLKGVTMEEAVMQLKAVLRQVDEEAAVQK